MTTTTGITRVFHFSEDGSITRFSPHVPPSNPGHPPSVWAIDEEHAPLYWFPRHCPRVSVWAYDDQQQDVLSSTFETDARRICAAETRWLDGIRSCRLYRYEFDASRFEPWADADGQYVAGEVIEPIEVVELGDLLALHAAADIELRITPKLGTLMDRILASGLPFSFVRLRDARR
jgi:Family of unknown function (DUF6886)